MVKVTGDLLTVTEAARVLKVNAPEHSRSDPTRTAQGNSRRRSRSEKMRGEQQRRRYSRASQCSKQHLFALGKKFAKKTVER
jgi:hypothetical protein